MSQYSSGSHVGSTLESLGLGVIYSYLIHLDQFPDRDELTKNNYLIHLDQETGLFK